MNILVCSSLGVDICFKVKAVPIVKKMYIALINKKIYVVQSYPAPAFCPPLNERNTQSSKTLRTMNIHAAWKLHPSSLYCRLSHPAGDTAAQKRLV